MNLIFDEIGDIPKNRINDDVDITYHKLEKWLDGYESQIAIINYNNKKISMEIDNIKFLEICGDLCIKENKFKSIISKDTKIRELLKTKPCYQAIDEETREILRELYNIMKECDDLRFKINKFKETLEPYEVTTDYEMLINENIGENNKLYLYIFINELVDDDNTYLINVARRCISENSKVGHFASSIMFYLSHSD